jgi:hypothetical protein
MENEHSIRCFLSIRLPQYVLGHVLKFLSQEDIIMLFQSIMILFLNGARFTKKPQHIIENPLKNHLLTFFKTQFTHMTSALPAFFKLNRVYRDILFKNRELLLSYLHIPLKSRTKFLTFTKEDLESKLLESVYNRNLIVYQTKYLPYMENISYVEGNKNELGYKIKQKRQMFDDFVSKYATSEEKNNPSVKFVCDFWYGLTDELFILYKQRVKKSFHLPPDFEPVSEGSQEVKYVKRTTKIDYVIETDLKKIREQQLQRQEEHKEKLRVYKLEQVRIERAKEKKQKQLSKQLSGKKRR